MSEHGGGPPRNGEGPPGDRSPATGEGDQQRRNTGPVRKPPVDSAPFTYRTENRTDACRFAVHELCQPGLCPATEEVPLFSGPADLRTTWVLPISSSRLDLVDLHLGDLDPVGDCAAERWQ